MNEDLFSLLWRVLVTIGVVGLIVSSFVAGTYVVSIGTIVGAYFFLRWIWDEYAE